MLIEEAQEKRKKANYARDGNLEVFVVIFVLKFVLFARDGDVHGAQDDSKV